MDLIRVHGAPPLMSKARLLKRVFDMDIDSRQKCVDGLKFVTAIEAPSMIASSLTHLRS